MLVTLQFSHTWYRLIIQLRIDTIYPSLNFQGLAPVSNNVGSNLGWGIGWISLRPAGVIAGVFDFVNAGFTFLRRMSSIIVPNFSSSRSLNSYSWRRLVAIWAASVVVHGSLDELNIARLERISSACSVPSTETAWHIWVITRSPMVALSRSSRYFDIIETCCFSAYS